MLFLEGKAFILTRTHSDHHPIRFVSSMGGRPDKDLKPFRFKAAWLTKEEYNTVWKTAWEKHEGDVTRAIEEVTRPSKE